MKKLLPLLFLILLTSCGSNNKESNVSDTIKKHPDAHSILFFDPSTTMIGEGDKTKDLLKLDYIAFSKGYVRVKFLGEDLITLNLKNEPSFSSKGSIFYHPEDEDYSFSISLGGSTFFIEKDGKFEVSYYTQSDEMKIKEYLNILANTNGKNPPVLVRLLEASEHSDDSFYSFN